MKNSVVILFALFACQYLLAADTLAVNSPDKKVRVIVYYKNELSYSIKYEGHDEEIERIQRPSQISGHALHSDHPFHRVLPSCLPRSPSLRFQIQ